MIRMEYDPMSAGVRVSFVLCDSERTSGCQMTLDNLSELPGPDRRHAPQTHNNLVIIQRMLTKAMEDAYTEEQRKARD